MYLDVIGPSATSVHNRGGGVLITVRNDVSALEISVPKCMGAEWVFIKMYFNSISYIICGVYFPPTSPVGVYDYESFTSELESIVSNNNGCVFIVCGDFNLPNVLWSNDETGLVPARKN